MQKLLLLLIIFSMFILGCTTVDTTEQPETQPIQEEAAETPDAPYNVCG